MRWNKNQGYKPNTSAERVYCRYRNGIESKAPYPVSGKGAVRWSLLQDPWDILEWAALADSANDDGKAWDAVSGGY